MANFSVADRLAIDGPQGAAALRRALGVSPATLSRMVDREGGEILRLGKARASRYALRRKYEGLPEPLPIYRIDSAGAPSLAGELFPLVRGTWIERSGAPGHLCARLPPALVDMTPAGALGERFSALHRELLLPQNLCDWSDDHRLIALARRGEDVPGDLVLGTESLDRMLRQRVAELRSVKRADYPRLAELSATEGGGPLLPGDQPKFAAYRGHHLLVKFTSGEGSPSELRWRDLLACEELALSTLAGGGIEAARAELVDVGPRRFLEVQRFDRIGERGRRGVLTLGAISDELFGSRDSWSEAAARLNQAELLSVEDARRVRLLEAFGICIGNGDRQFGNLAFFADALSPRPALQLAAAYDMLPMNAAPHAGVIPPLPSSEPVPQAKLLDVWREALLLARRFWSCVRDDARISRTFRKAAPRAG